MVVGPRLPDRDQVFQDMTDRSSASPRRLSSGALVMLAALTLFWGLNWPAMRVIVAELPVWHFRVMCLAIGGLTLLAVAWLRGLPVAVPRGQVLPLVLSALIYMAGWHMLTALGLMLIEAGRASIIAFTMPLWAAVMAGPVLGEHIGTRRWLALALGVGGLGLLILPAIGRIGASPLVVVVLYGLREQDTTEAVRSRQIHRSRRCGNSSQTRTAGLPGAGRARRSHPCRGLRLELPAAYYGAVHARPSRRSRRTPAPADRRVGGAAFWRWASDGLPAS
ncbi:MAG: EamA family transporter [Alphaproteobacteria bacterium]|nr:EamA family transporter [Alphaproteobacteria bacterium]